MDDETWEHIFISAPSMLVFRKMLTKSAQDGIKCPNSFIKYHYPSQTVADDVSQRTVLMVALRRFILLLVEGPQACSLGDWCYPVLHTGTIPLTP